ncbi:MDR family oxidoreductase [Methylobacillus rhizosphaerae]|nr:MDR family oxidoreductase [Methylobacillus rhizosphaerae]
MIEKSDTKYSTTLKELDEAQLPEGDVTVKVSYSTINYKDALAITGKGPIVRNFPMIPGIDFVGVVEQSSHPDFKVGDNVILNGWGVGETHWGGLAQLARVNGDWLIPLPPTLSPKHAMTLGTAGYTAMLCIQALLQHGLKPEDGEIAVTGATGGVGSVATLILSQLGFQVVAITSSLVESDYLKSLGATEVMDKALLPPPSKPLLKERWAAAIDVLGGKTLSSLCSSTRYQGIVAACGLAESIDLPITVAPFILRGVTLAGIDSVRRSKADRIIAWERLAKLADSARLEALTTEISLEDVPRYCDQLLNNQFRGRFVVNTGTT